MDISRIVLISIELSCTFFYVFLIFSSFPGFHVLDDLSRSFLKVMILCALLTLVDAGAWYFDGKPDQLSWIMVRMSNFSLYLVQYLLIGSLFRTISITIRQSGGWLPRWFNNGFYIALAVLIALLFITPMTDFYYFFDASNYYVRGPGASIALGGGVSLLAVGCILMLINYPHIGSGNTTIFLLCILMVIVATVVQMKYYGFSFTNVGVTVGVMVVTTGQNRIKMQRMLTQQRQLEEQSEQLKQAQLSLLRSQIKPHFLFNSLAVIRSLCMENVQKATRAINSFSMFLRRSIDILDEEKLISFEEELELVNSYLYLEQERFPNAFDVIMDLEERDFQVPALSIQPLVENSIKHGLRGREDHGTLTLRTEYEDNNFIVTITDDGIGFDPEAVQNDGKAHTGLNNVGLRLSLLAGGRLIVDSSPGKGTRYTVLIPDPMKDEA